MGRAAGETRGWSSEQWMEWRKEAKSFKGLAAYSWTFNFLIRNDGSQSIQGMVVTKDYMRVMGLQPVLGRGFEEQDFAAGPPKVMFWVRVLAADIQRRSDIIGKTVRISRADAPPTIIGVMPAGIRFLPSPGASKEPNYNENAMVEFWSPVEPDPKNMKDPDGMWWRG